MTDILVVDDQTGIRLLLQEILQHQGYTVQTAATGQEAITKLSEKQFGLLMIDNQMPIYSGVEVLEKMQAQDMLIPTIFMTGMREGIACEDWLREVTETVIEKPFNLPDVCNLVKEILDREKG